jgi:hypothetical protein
MPTSDERPATSDSFVFACNMDAFEPDQRERHRELSLRLIRGSRRTVTELEQGYRFDLNGGAELLPELGEWAALEHLCCPFFDFVIAFDAQRRRASLTILGPEGVKAFLVEELGWAM